MKRKIILLLLAALPFLPARVHAHTEVVGKIVFKNFENELYATAILDKRLLTVALMNEGECAPKDMLKVCATRYVQAHIKFIVNCEEVDYKQLSVDVQQTAVVISYQVEADAKAVETISVSSSYMLKYNDHAMMQVHFAIGEEDRVFNLHADRQKIEATFNKA